MPDHDAEDSLISALADGELRGEEFSRALELLARSDRAMAVWKSYHMVGEVLRGEPTAASQGGGALLERLRAQLEGPAAHALQLAQAPTQPAASRPESRRPANDSARRWRWLAVAASMVAVATVGWHLLSLDRSAGGPLLAQDRAGAGQDAESPAVMLRDPRLDELMAAHRQFGGTSALQMPSGFLRNATFGPPSGPDAP